MFFSEIEIADFTTVLIFFTSLNLKYVKFVYMENHKIICLGLYTIGALNITFCATVDEYAAALAKYDQSLLDGTYDDLNNKSVFSISKYSSADDKNVLVSSLNSPPKKKSNTVGDVGNPFETLKCTNRLW